MSGSPAPERRASAGYGPEARPRAVVLTFDNLGEASELERGSWDAGAPRGAHPSVTEALPRLLDELHARGLRATFFVEAINCELNPEAMADIAARGHELGVHGWRHEPWGQLDADDEAALLRRSTEAFAARGLPADAFRPPGGAVTPRTAGLLRELGYRWCSPAGDAPHVSDGLAWVPFDWRLVDAYHLMEHFADVRRRHRDPAAALAPDAAAERILAQLAEGPAVQTLILHPFLMLDPGWWRGARRVLARVADLAREGAAWAASGGEFARWLADTVASPGL